MGMPVGYVGDQESSPLQFMTHLLRADLLSIGTCWNVHILRRHDRTSS